MLSRIGLFTLCSTMLAGCASMPSMDLEQLADELASYDVVFLGEEHDNSVGHLQHHELLRLLYVRRPELVITMEMFERDVQEVLDDYLSGETDEDGFLASARPWKGYRRHYRPFVEFAKAHGLPVIAANAPTAAVREVSGGGEVSEAQRPYVARETTAPKDAYWRAFVEAMSGHDNVEEDDTVRAYYRAQCLRDDTMAESIVAQLGSGGARPLVVHVVGQFHVTRGLGTASRVADRAPDVCQAVVTMESHSNVVRRGPDEFVLVVPTEPEPPEAALVEVVEVPEPDPVPSGRPALGLKPDYEAVDGVGIEMLVDGGPAERAGLEEGDIIVRLGGRDVIDLQSYMEILSSLQVGANAEAIVDRGGRLVTVEVEVGTRR